MLSCAGYMGHPFKKNLSDNDYDGFQVPFLRTDVLSSQHRGYEAAELALSMEHKELRCGSDYTEDLRVAKGIGGSFASPGQSGHEPHPLTRSISNAEERGVGFLALAQVERLCPSYLCTKLIQPRGQIIQTSASSSCMTKSMRSASGVVY